MLNHHPNPGPSVAADPPPPAVQLPLPAGLDLRLFPWQILAPLSQAIESLQRGADRGGAQLIIRFKNGFGAFISAYRLLEGIYEVAPLRFCGSGPGDYELYFRSHVPDLTWCSESADMVAVCDQISRLLPSGRV